LLNSATNESNNEGLVEEEKEELMAAGKRSEEDAERGRE
jgi:hypothetical protein